MVHESLTDSSLHYATGQWPPLYAEVEQFNTLGCQVEVASKHAASMMDPMTSARTENERCEKCAYA